MRKKIVLLVLGCIVVLGSSAVPANAVNIIFSDDFNGWRVDPILEYEYYWARLPSNWDVFYQNPYVAWFDIGYEQHLTDPNFHEDPNDRKMVLDQWGTTGDSNIGIVTKEYYNVTLCTQLDVNLTWVIKPEADVNIIPPIIEVKALYYDNNLNSKGEAVATIADHNTPRGSNPDVAYVWNNSTVTMSVPAGTTLVKFEVLNDSSGGGHGAFWFDNFIVTDPVCVNRPSMDLNRDCKVDVSDLATFALQWLDCGLVIQGSVTGCW
jgi:hypothetical protein